MVDDASNQILKSGIKIVLGEFKKIYLNLMNREIIESNVNYLTKGIKDYIYITSDNNHIIEYIEDNYNKLSEEELIIRIINMTYEYGLGDVQIKSMINKFLGRM